MALIPTLGEQILVELDVESLTQELQAKSRASRLPLEPPQPPSESSLTSSIDILPDQDAPSDAESASVSSFSGQEEVVHSSNLTESSQSWVDQFSTLSSTSGLLPVPSNATVEVEVDSGDLGGTQLSDSVTTDGSAISYRNETGIVSKPTLMFILS